MDATSVGLMRAVEEAVTAIKVNELAAKNIYKIKLPAALKDGSSIAKRAIHAAQESEMRDAVNIAVVATFTYKVCLEEFMSTLSPPKDPSKNDPKLDSPDDGANLPS